MKGLKIIQGLALFFLLIPLVFVGGFFASFLVIAVLFVVVPFLAFGLLFLNNINGFDFQEEQIFLLPPKAESFENDNFNFNYNSNLIYFSDLAKRMEISNMNRVSSEQTRIYING